MATLPALQRAYHTNGNIPFGSNNTTSAIITKYAMWLLKAVLANQIVAGSTGGTARNPASVWTVKGSSDGVTAGMDGVDRWTSTFTPSLIVGAASGNAHSWIVLENLNIGTTGVQMCIDYTSTSDGHWSHTFTKVGTGSWSGGSTTVRPQNVSNSEEWVAAQGNLGTSAAAMMGDTTAMGTFWGHITFAPNGEFIYLVSRSSSTRFSCGISCWTTVNGRTADTRNVWAIAEASSFGRGVFLNSSLAQNTNATRRGPSNLQQSSQGAMTINFGSSPYVGNSGTDFLTSDYLAFPINLGVLGATPTFCGQLIDWHWIGTATVGSSIPSASAQERTITGDVIIPFMGVVANL